MRQSLHRDHRRADGSRRGTPRRGHGSVGAAAGGPGRAPRQRSAMTFEDLGNVDVAQPESIPDRVRARAVPAADRADLYSPWRHGRSRAVGTANSRWCWAAITRSRSARSPGLSQNYREQGEKHRPDLDRCACGHEYAGQQSPSGNVHGMPLACCIGDGPPELTDILRLRAESEPAQCGHRRLARCGS